MISEFDERHDSPDSPGFSSLEFQLAAQELMSEDPAVEVRVFNNGKKILTLTLEEPEIHGATKTRNIYLRNVPGPRELFQKLSHLRQMIRWVTHPDPNLPRERQDERKEIFLGSLRQTRALMHELGV